MDVNLGGTLKNGYFGTTAALCFAGTRATFAASSYALGQIDVGGEQKGEVATKWGVVLRGGNICVFLIFKGDQHFLGPNAMLHCTAFAQGESACACSLACV